VDHGQLKTQPKWISGEKRLAWPGGSAGTQPSSVRTTSMMRRFVYIFARAHQARRAVVWSNLLCRRRCQSERSGGLRTGRTKARMRTATGQRRRSGQALDTMKTVDVMIEYQIETTGTDWMSMYIYSKSTRHPHRVHIIVTYGLSYTLPSSPPPRPVDSA
jgi:hypothetical protein